MKTRTSLSAIAFALAVVGALALAGPSRADEGEGEDMNVHNHTGHEVLVFLFQDAEVHTNEEGGTQLAHLQDGESAVAHVPHCTFSILLVDHEDVWHAEFHDCHSTELTFNKDTGHAKKE